MLHPLCGKAAVLADGIGILGGIGGLENGDGHGCLPGDLSGRIGRGVDKGIHTHLILLGGVSEAAILMDGHGATLGLAGDGEGHGLPLGIADFQLPRHFQVFIGLQGRILCHGGLVFFSANRQRHHGRIRHMILINGKISDLRRTVLLRQQRGEGHLRHLFRSQNIPGLQHPGAQHNGAHFTFGQIGDADAHHLLRAKIPGGEAVNAVAVHLRSIGSANHAAETGKGCQQSQNTIWEHNNTSRKKISGGIVCQCRQNYSRFSKKGNYPALRIRRSCITNIRTRMPSSSTGSSATLMWFAIRPNTGGIRQEPT